MIGGGAGREAKGGDKWATRQHIIERGDGAGAAGEKAPAER
jgi:hypothetical protein